MVARSAPFTRKAVASTRREDLLGKRSERCYFLHLPMRTPPRAAGRSGISQQSAF